MHARTLAASFIWCNMDDPQELPEHMKGAPAAMVNGIGALVGRALLRLEQSERRK